MRRRRVELGYLVSVGAIAAALLALEWVRVDPSSPVELVYLTLLGFALIPLSVLLVSTFVYVSVRSRAWPRATPAEPPRVAILFVARDDVLPQAIRLTLDNLEYPNAAVWLLTDSSSPEALAIEEALPAQVQRFRRPEPRGGKAGAINDWLRDHGAGVRYVVPMDSDALLAPGSLQTLVEIAEHPANRAYAGFQTLMEVHPAVATSPFARILGRGVKWGCRIVPLANQRLFGQAMYWGSNALLRVDAVVAAGGWVEDNICEDFALTARLDAAGHPIALVDVYNYEGFPPDALSLRERTERWCKANLSIAPAVFRANTSFAVRLNVAIPLLFYLMAPVLLGLVLINVVTPPDVPLQRVSTTLGAFLLLFVFLHRLVVVPRHWGSLARFAATVAAETLVILGMSLRVAWCFVQVRFRRPIWVPSRKAVRPLTRSESFRHSVPELAFGLVLLTLTVAFHSPWTSVLLSGIWIASFLSTPLVLWASSQSDVRGRGAGDRGRDTSKRTRVGIQGLTAYPRASAPPTSNIGR